MSGRYVLFDPVTRRWLKAALLPDGDTDALATDWTRDRAEAQGFSGLKTARRMAERLESRRGEVEIQRGT